MLTTVQFMDDEDVMFQNVSNITFGHWNQLRSALDRLQVQPASTATIDSGFMFPDYTRVNHYRPNKSVRTVREVIFDIKYSDGVGSRTTLSSAGFVVTIGGSTVAIIFQWSIGSNSLLPNVIGVTYYDGTQMVQEYLTASFVSGSSYPYNQNLLKLGFDISKDVNDEHYYAYPYINLNGTVKSFASGSKTCPIDKDDFAAPSLSWICQTGGTGIHTPLLTIGAWD